MKIWKGEEFVAKLRDKKESVIHTANLKQVLNHGLVLKKVHRFIKFNQEAWLKPCIDMTLELRKNAKNDFKKDIFKLKNNAVFGKTMENMRKHGDIKLVTTVARGTYSESEPNYHTIKVFSDNFLAIKVGRTQLLMKKLFYLGLPILEISKIVMYEFWYGYLKPKFEKKQNCVTFIQTAP